MKSSTKQGKPIVVLDSNIAVSALIAKKGAPRAKSLKIVVILIDITIKWCFYGNKNNAAYSLSKA